MKALLLTLGLLAAPLALQAQQVYNCPAHNTRCDAFENFIVGGVLNVALRGPWVAKGWHKPVPRILLGSAITVLYYNARAYEEQGREPYGFHPNWPNVGYTIVGLVGTELLSNVLKLF